jgi:tRNA 2-thiouridine synthesizing protein E
MNPDPADPTGRDLPEVIADWSRKTAERTAVDEGIEMTDTHWAVVDFLREYYREHGATSSGPDVAEAMDIAFAEQGGSAYLHQLFPEGPVAQGSRIAGLPVPPGSVDESFGSAM